ncbi:unnamed protein product [Vitrella brassicaformis CCMP3155]|uniref:TRP C-terminal domain-containing protein n=1 Tax=Vitrella brassicaformis (strain CCMP3155) TaxID=1169540 RepID=A0A0G4EYT2_VITBC|nr:unnamed protein product [Vitrella brassicaformis CCMP3155]|eukprot:CEM04321.1 unnamed protein product [Vitrella brassicaformis CCMP3155]
MLATMMLYQLTPLAAALLMQGDLSYTDTSADSVEVPAFIISFVWFATVAWTLIILAAILCCPQCGFCWDCVRSSIPMYLLLGLTAVIVAQYPSRHFTEQQKTINLVGAIVALVLIIGFSIVLSVRGASILSGYNAMPSPEQSEAAMVPGGGGDGGVGAGGEENGVQRDEQREGEA